MTTSRNCPLFNLANLVSHAQYTTGNQNILTAVYKYHVVLIDAQTMHLLSKPCPSFIALMDEASRSNVISFPTDMPGPPCRLFGSPAVRQRRGAAFVDGGRSAELWCLAAASTSRHRPLRRQCSAKAAQLR